GDVEHRFVAVNHTGKLDALVSELNDRDRGRTLVFVRTKRGADRLVKRLKAHDVHAAAMHGDKTQGQRERALARFTAGDTDTLVATDVAARGLDVDDITHVINFDLPGAREDYVHRVGRTGRAGRTGVGITFVVPDQHGDMKKMARELDLTDEYAAATRRNH
ncbi:MAG: box helicase domain protein, partial [Solirubrobacterales bacterium]|nr:box helicase domain protein [Solirubrobacterales bacterium]